MLALGKGSNLQYACLGYNGNIHLKLPDIAIVAI